MAASHLDWSGTPDVLGPLGWLVTAIPGSDETNNVSGLTVTLIC